MFGNYLWIPVLGKSQGHGTRDKRADTKNHQDHCWCYVILVQIFQRNLFGTGWWLCAKMRHLQPHSRCTALRENRQCIAVPTHLPGCTPFCSAQPAQPYVTTPIMRKYAWGRVFDRHRSWKWCLGQDHLIPKGFGDYITCACVQFVQGTLSRSVFLETMFLKECICFLGLPWHVTKPGWFKKTKINSVTVLEARNPEVWNQGISRVGFPGGSKGVFIPCLSPGSGGYGQSLAILSL